MKKRVFASALTLILALTAIFALTTTSMAYEDCPPPIASSITWVPVNLLVFDPGGGEFVVADFIEPDYDNASENYLYALEGDTTYWVDFDLTGVLGEEPAATLGGYYANYSCHVKSDEVGTITVKATLCDAPGQESAYWGELMFVVNADLWLTHQSASHSVELQNGHLRFPLITSETGAPSCQNYFHFASGTSATVATIIGDPNSAQDLYTADLESYLLQSPPTASLPAPPLPDPVVLLPVPPDPELTAVG